MYISSSDVSDILVAAKSLCTGHTDLFTLFFAEKDVPDIEELQRVLTGAGIRFMGGITPGLIVGTTLRDSGTLIRRYKCAAGPFIVPDFVTNDISRDIVHDLEMPSAGGDDTVMMYFPGPNSASRFLRQVYGIFGNRVTYIGSGMGYEDGVPRPSVFSNEVFSDSAAVFAVISAECTVAARHGFIPISDQMVLTGTDQNVVEEINWKNPRDEYLAAIKEDYQREYPGKTLEECIAYYPMVFETDFPESVCRAVLQIAPDGSLVGGGDVPENAVFRVAKYFYESLLEAAVFSAETVTEDMQERPAVLFLIDCICRKWIAGDRYCCVLEAVQKAVSQKTVVVQMEGILSFGEISSMGTGMLECLNYTCVAGRFYED